MLARSLYKTFRSPNQKTTTQGWEGKKAHSGVLFCWLNTDMELLESGNNPGSATFHPGSVCNLACVTCGPNNSTRWQQEMGQAITGGNPTSIDEQTLSMARRMNGVVICGGEPMLNHSSATMLENLQPEQQVRVHFNGTVLPKASFLEQSKKFNTIQYCFSIDGVGERFEYLRWPAQWDQVVNNIQKLMATAPNNVEFAVNITISELNKMYYQEVIDWVTSTIPCNRVGKSTVINTQPAWEHFLDQQYLDDLDKKRNTNWKQLFPLAKIKVRTRSYTS